MLSIQEAIDWLKIYNGYYLVVIIGCHLAFLQREPEDFL